MLLKQPRTSQTNLDLIIGPNKFSLLIWTKLRILDLSEAQILAETLSWQDYLEGLILSN